MSNQSRRKQQKVKTSKARHSKTKQGIARHSKVIARGLPPAGSHTLSLDRVSLFFPKRIQLFLLQLAIIKQCVTRRTQAQWSNAAVGDKRTPFVALVFGDLFSERVCSTMVHAGYATSRTCSITLARIHPKLIRKHFIGKDWPTATKTGILDRCFHLCRFSHVFFLFFCSFSDSLARSRKNKEPEFSLFLCLFVCFSLFLSLSVA